MDRVNEQYKKYQESRNRYMSGNYKLVIIRRPFEDTEDSIRNVSKEHAHSLGEQWKKLKLICDYQVKEL